MRHAPTALLTSILFLGCGGEPAIDAGVTDARLAISDAGPLRDGGPNPDAAIPGGPPVALNIRVEGLALGGEVSLAQNDASVTARFNDPYAFAPQVPAGSALDLRVTGQPPDQTCAVSELAPALVPADGAPVFVRCVHDIADRVTVPTTMPDEALSVGLAPRDVAYPGLPYESRAGVLGGTFPYEFRLLSVTRDGAMQSTEDVSFDFRRGTLRFTPETEGLYAFNIEIRDSRATQRVLTHTFEVRAESDAFLFIATDGVDATGRGSVTQPFQTLAYALSQSTAGQVLMLRRGIYLTGGFTLNDTHAKQVLAYPDEVVVLDLMHAGNINTTSNTGLPVRIEGVDIAHVRQYGIHSDPTRSGLVVRNVRFLDGEEGTSVSENPAFIHGRGDGTRAWRHRMLIQDNDFGPYVMHSSGGYALTLFDAGESLVENNQIRLGPVTGGIHDKDNSQHNTYRENYIAFEARAHGIVISAQDNSDGVHIHHNLMINAGVVLGIQCFDAACYMRDTHVHHNTLQNGVVTMNWGPFNPTSARTSVLRNIVVSDARAPFGGLSCQPGIPSGFATQLTSGANLFTSTSMLAFKDSECTRNDMTWTAWRALGMDTATSGSAVSTTSPLVGTTSLTGLPVGDARRAQAGHLYR